MAVFWVAEGTREPPGGLLFKGTDPIPEGTTLMTSQITPKCPASSHHHKGWGGVRVSTYAFPGDPDIWIITKTVFIKRNDPEELDTAEVLKSLNLFVFSFLNMSRSD